MDEIKVQTGNAVEVMEAQERASYDIQIATAKRFPRDVKRARENAITIATMDKDTAQSCGYALPRGGKPIQGPSVHLARILAQCWGNLRVETRVAEITHNQIVSHAIAFDLENNYAAKVEVRKKILDKHGNRFNDDMITVTGNAANSIALRNAIFNVIPQSVTKAAYQATRNTLTGDLSSEEKLIKRRSKSLEYFQDQYGATEAEILKVLGVGSIHAIRQEQILVLLELEQALKDGDTTPEEAFNRKSEKQKEAEKNTGTISGKIKDQIGQKPSNDEQKKKTTTTTASEQKKPEAKKAATTTKDPVNQPNIGFENEKPKGNGSK